MEVAGGELSRYTVTPEDVSLERAPANAIPGGDPQQNADIARRIFAGELGAGA